MNPKKYSKKKEENKVNEPLIAYQSSGVRIYHSFEEAEQSELSSILN